MSDEALTIKKILDYKSDLLTYYSVRNALFSEDEVYYELQFKSKLGLPEEYKEDGVVLPTARDIVDTATDHVSTANVRFFRPRLGESQEAKEQAEMLRKFDVGMFFRTKMESQISPWRVATKHTFLHGMHCFETLYDPDRWIEPPERPEGMSDEDWAAIWEIYKGNRHNSLPISIRAVHPRCVFPDTSDPPRFVMIIETKTWNQARKDWVEWVPTLESPVPPASSRLIEHITYFDCERRCVLVNSQKVLPGDGIISHNYGFIPYSVGYSGLGNQSPTALPELRAVGLLRYLRPLLRSESFAYSVYNITLKASSWPITFVSGPGADSLTSIKMKYGKIYEKPAGVVIEDYVKTPPPEIVMQHMAYTNAILSASAAPRSVRGLGEENVRSSVDRSLVIDQARLKYDSVKEQMELSTAKVMSDATKILERLVPNDIYVWARTPVEEFDTVIKKDKIDHHYTTYVEFTPSSAEEDARRHADGMNLMRVGAISSSTMRHRYLNNIDSESEDIKVEAERLRANPLVQEALAQMVVVEIQPELERLRKINMLRAGINPKVATNQVATGAMPSGPGGAQEASVGMRQTLAQPGRNMAAQKPGTVENIQSIIQQAQGV